MAEHRFEPTPTAEEKYRPINSRQRLAIVALAIVTAIGIVLILLDPPGGVVRKRPPVPACAASTPDASGCVGGMATVIAPALPASAMPSAAAAASQSK